MYTCYHASLLHKIFFQHVEKYSYFCKKYKDIDIPSGALSLLHRNLVHMWKDTFVYFFGKKCRYMYRHGHISHFCEKKNGFMWKFRFYNITNNSRITCGKLILFYLARIKVLVIFVWCPTQQIYGNPKMLNSYKKVYVWGHYQYKTEKSFTCGKPIFI